MNLMDAAVISDWLTGSDLLAIGSSFTVAMALVLLMLWLERGALSVIAWPIIGLAQMVVGHAVLDVFFFEDLFWPWFAAGAIALLLGYRAISREVMVAALLELPRPQASAVQERIAVVFACLVSFFVAYHFVVGGVPLFASELEVQRFNFTSSGLWGIPGRVFLFGLPFTVTYCSYVAHASDSKRARLLVHVMWAEFFVAMALSGFKGALIMVVLQWLLVRSMLGKPVKIRSLLRARYLAFVLGAILFGGVMARQYDSLELSDSSATAVYFAQRATVIAASAGAVAVRTDLRETPGFYVLDDFSYLIKKYTGIAVLDTDSFPLDKVISSELTGTPLEEDEFNVPVTVGGFPSLVVDFGKVVAIVLMFAIGLLYGFVLQRAVRTPHPFWFGAYGLALQMTYAFVVNGNFAYCVINTVAMIGFLLILHRASCVLAGAKGDALAHRAVVSEPV